MPYNYVIWAIKLRANSKVPYYMSDSNFIISLQYKIKQDYYCLINTKTKREREKERERKKMNENSACTDYSVKIMSHKFMHQRKKSLFLNNSQHTTYTSNITYTGKYFSHVLLLILHLIFHTLTVYLQYVKHTSSCTQT